MNVLGMCCLSRLRARNVTDARRLDAALARDLLDRRKLQESVERRQHHVVRVGGAQALREHIGDAGALHDGADGATGDHAGARRGGLHEHLARAMLADHFVRDRPTRHRDRHHFPLRRIDGLAHGFRHLVRLARGEAHLPLAIADGDERVEGEPPAALHDLGDAVDRDDVLDQVALLATAVTSAAAAIATATTTITAATAARSTALTATATATATATTAAATTATAAW